MSAHKPNAAQKAFSSQTRPQYTSTANRQRLEAERAAERDQQMRDWHREQRERVLQQPRWTLPEPKDAA